MDRLINGRIFLLRLATASLAAVFIVMTPILGLTYGTTGALALGGLAFVSPLEMILVFLGSGTLLIDLFVGGSIVILIIVLFGRFFCGWVCPVGVPLDHLHSKISRNHRGGGIDTGRNLEKYAILVGVLAAVPLFDFSAPYLFSPPGAAYRTMLSIVLRGAVGADLAVLGLFLTLDLLAIRVGRSWCNTLCPLGTVIGSLGFVNLFRPVADMDRCIDVGGSCLRCEGVCPVNIPLRGAGRWDMMACTKCLRCLESCPAKAIKIETFG